MNLHSGDPWSEADLIDLRNSLSLGDSVEEVADFICRDVDEVREKMRELGLSESPQASRGG